MLDVVVGMCVLEQYCSILLCVHVFFVVLKVRVVLLELLTLIVVLIFRTFVIWEKKIFSVFICVCRCLVYS